MTITDPKKSNSLALIILLFIIISTALVIIFVLSNNKSKPTTNNTNNNQQTNNTSKEPRPIISGWNVYESKEYGFRVDYPKEWKAEEIRGGDFPVHAVDFLPKNNNGNDVRINFEFNPDDLSLKEWIDKNKKSFSFDEGFLESKGLLPDQYVDKIILDGAEAYKIINLSEAYFAIMMYKDKKDVLGYLAECGCNFDGEGIIFQKNNKIITIGAAYDMHESDTQNKLIIKNNRYEVESPDPIYNESKETFAKMISSFRWIK